jgi:acyl carrier protein
MSEDERRAMAATDERMNAVMLSIIRRRTPDADVGDFGKQIYDLDMDSLDVVDLSQALEKEFGVEADLERVADCLTPSDISAYFRELIGSP